MNQFQIALKQKRIVCDICGCLMLPIFGGGWENDLIVCTDHDCGAEIVYPSSTPVPEGKK